MGQVVPNKILNRPHGRGCIYGSGSAPEATRGQNRYRAEVVDLM